MLIPNCHSYQRLTIRPHPYRLATHRRTACLFGPSSGATCGLAWAQYLVVFLIFVAVLWNGGIVLGAKDAHVVSPHLMQILYFGLVSAAPMGSTHFSLEQVLAIYDLFSKRKLSSFLVLFFGLILVHFFDPFDFIVASTTKFMNFMCAV